MTRSDSLNESVALEREEAYLNAQLDEARRELKKQLAQLDGSTGASQRRSRTEQVTVEIPDERGTPSSVPEGDAALEALASQLQVTHSDLAAAGDHAASPPPSPPADASSEIDLERTHRLHGRGRLGVLVRRATELLGADKHGTSSDPCAASPQLCNQHQTQTSSALPLR